MLLQRATLTSSSARPFCAVANVRCKRTVIRPQAIPAHKCSPPRTPACTTGARLSAAGAGLSVAGARLFVAGARLSAAGAGLAAPAPAPLRILIVPALHCISHSGDSQDEPASTNAAAAREEQPADSKPFAARKDQPANLKAPAVFFGREVELGMLAELAGCKPGVMRVVLGPRSCGTTATLTEFQRTRQNVAAINMRRITANTPAAFVKMVLLELARVAPRTAFEEAVQRLMAATATKQAGKTLMAFGEVVGGLVEGVRFTAKDVLSGVQDSTMGSTPMDMTLNVGKVAWDAFGRMWGGLFAPSSQVLEGNDMGTLTQGIEALVDAWGTKKQEGDLQEWPVIIIDEANVLMQWTDKYPSELAELLRVLIRISKEANLCHVILATSEWGFTGWLEQRIGYEFYQPAVIGDFPAEQAREFFRLELQRRGIELEEATWEKVFEVGGGNAGFLHQLAAQVPKPKSTNKVDWDTALADAVVARQRATERHAGGGDALGWSAKQYAAAAKKLLRAQYHAVPRKEMAMLLGELAEGGGKDEENELLVGQQVLEKMVAANALALRPLSSWAQDIPMKAFMGVDEVVTAPTAVALHCMRRLLQPVEEDSDETTSE